MHRLIAHPLAPCSSFGRWRDGCSLQGRRYKTSSLRRGTDRLEAVVDVMDKALLRTLQPRLDSLADGSSKQPSTNLWKGGYWHETLPKLHGKGLDIDKSKAKWRVEHLPSATEVLVTGFIAAVSGYLDSLGRAGDDFRGDSPSNPVRRTRSNSTTRPDVCRSYETVGRSRANIRVHQRDDRVRRHRQTGHQTSTPE